MDCIKLSDVANVQSGLVLNRKEASPDLKMAITYRQLNLRSVNEDGTLNMETLSEFRAADILDEQFITKENDIVMRLFAPLRPVMITKDSLGLVVPSQFSIIRVRLPKVLPAFLCYYLSQDDMINEMATKSSGHALRGINISTLSETPIPLLTLERQKKIVALWDTHLQRKRLYLELIHQYNVQAGAVIKGIIGGEGNGHIKEND